MKSRLLHELTIVINVTLFFLVWFGILIALKTLILAEYQIEFYGLSVAVLGALVTAKVVLILHHVSLGRTVQSLPPIVEVLIRTVLYTLGVAIVLTLEKIVEGRHDHDGIMGTITSTLSHPDMRHVWATTISVGIGMFLYNLYTLLVRKLGNEQLKELLLKGVRHDSGKSEQRTDA